MTMMSTELESPAFKLLLSCCCLKPSDWAKRIRDAALDTGVDFKEFLDLADRHRISPLVYLQLKGDSRIDKDVLLILKERFEVNRLQALGLKGKEQWLAAELSSRNINFVFLKGLQLAEKYYGDLACRHVFDLDVLVQETSLPVVNEIMVGKGYVSDPDLFHFNAIQKLFYTAVYHDLMYRLPFEKSGMIEVHWRYRDVLSGFDLSVIRPLDPVEEFLYVCTHGTEHGWFRLKWLCDVVQMIDSGDFDWQRVADRAVELGCLTHLQLTWLLLSRLFSRTIPLSIQKDLTQSMHKRKFRHILSCIGSKASIYEGSSMPLSHLLFTLGFKKRMAGIPLVMRYLSSPADWKLMPLPGYLFWVYFLFRPVFMIWRKLKV
jgi:hypothetical protein